MTSKVIALTGGAAGIGLATASLLVSQGAKVAISDVNATNLRTAEASLREQCKDGGEILATVVDVRRRDQVDGWIAEVVEKFGKLDGAANLAGVIPKSINIERVEDLNDEDWQFVLDVNITGVMQCMRAEIRQMNENGSIVNAASIAGLGGFPKNAAYTVAKHGVIGITKTAAKEVGDRSIRVNCIAPGIIDTEMHRESVRIRGKEGDYKIQIPRKGQPEEVAALIAWLLCDGSQYITGTVQIIDGGVMA
ncbi:NAD(P)-binding protein [Aaosphaeria arxii CBS 175.79]|uniref:NAD(P)-binding protein n=1 Tax=Aaosphaeria arxii CBS 175.79 TaxID=1450172 RepID=A0A6A5Y4L8_9PLEO|nr:NAD(P)-binding protein [Aaosphaeria arxii CBS 175.79]KAF2019821.1 NAD(P)-binding protein [Aaosphaeria arxii CBS 175.79]